MYGSILRKGACVMKYASEELIAEHEGILAGLDILERMCELIGRKSDVDVRDLTSMLYFFKLFADTCHHGKEEGLLFPEMERAGIPRENGPIGQMLLEHAEGRKLMAAMSAAIDGVFDKHDFAAAASSYVKLLRSHIEKENNVLFPMGDRKLPAEEQSVLLEKFEEHEREVMGEGTHDSLHELLHRLTEKYLPEGNDEEEVFLP